MLASPAVAFLATTASRATAPPSAVALSAKITAEQVLEKPKWPPEWPYSDVDFARMDESEDSIFYDSPRLVRAENGR